MIFVLVTRVQKYFFNIVSYLINKMCIRDSPGTCSRVLLDLGRHLLLLLATRMASREGDLG